MKCKCGSNWECVCPECHQWAPIEGWISIHDQLPKEDQLVLVYMRGLVSLRIFDNKAFHDLESDYYTPLLMENGVTHWMPLPEPPLFEIPINCEIPIKKGWTGGSNIAKPSTHEIPSPRLAKTWLSRDEDKEFWDSNLWSGRND